MVDCGSNNSNTNRFVCPNDRQLALRAKLKTGWSMKTAAFGYPPAQPPQTKPLDEKEQAAIVEVIQRAEKVDLTEQERVGRLVERLENLRRNALGRNPSQCLLCGDGFGMLGAQKVICMDCKRLACTKCAIESYTGRNQSNSRDHWLCMICAETREMWKKSGAWFFKSIPKYILPSEEVATIPPSSFRHNRSMRMSRSGGIRTFRGLRKADDEDSSSEEEKKQHGNVWNNPRRNSSTESMHDLQVQPPAQDQDIFPTMSNNYSRQTSSSESQLSKDLEPLRSYMGSVTLSEVKSWEDSTSENLEVSRRESMASWSEDKVSPSSSSATSSVFKEDSSKPIDSSTTMGMIELSLMYDQITSTLHCTIYRAKNLIPMDISGLSDPFCKLNIVPDAKPSTRLRTKTVHKTRNPEFNENLTFYDITESVLGKKSLHILVVDDDQFGHDYMGETKISLGKLKVQTTIYLTVALENLRIEQKGPLPAPELKEWFDDLWSRGQILLSLCYSTKRRSLLVTVLKCANLLPMDNNGFSDPFVKLQLHPTTSNNNKKHRTGVKWKNLNPVFNEEFAFDTRPNELYTQSLYITVYDRDYGKSDDYLGGLVLGGVGSKGQRLKHWLDMIRYPDHRHEAWHNLTERTLEFKDMKEKKEQGSGGSKLM